MWQIVPSTELPQWLTESLKCYLNDSSGHFAAQLLWQRGIRDPESLRTFLDPDRYQPTSPFVFGQEMKWAIMRIFKASQTGEKVTIWGDFDTDGITATSLLWEGLGQIFNQYLQLNYYIPNRLTESHGLNVFGLEQLASQGTTLIISCDTGSTNLAEIEYAKSLGIDLIVTDHHSLPEDRPEVVSMLNPRYFAENHPLYNLSGVAVAYKLMEALYLTYPEIFNRPLENLLDLVGIGLIADLVQLVGECRYLAQQGIKQLAKTNRLGVAHLLKLCRKTGDRPMDISFGLAPRINAVSRIYGDSSFCVELLTSSDEARCLELAEKAELANSRRQLSQKRILQEVKKKLTHLELSTTNIIVLEDPAWDVGILGLVAAQIAEEYNRPTILFQTDGVTAKGSARSVNNIDLYELVQSQSYLLTRFGGHPFAAGLSLSLENLPIFKQAINQQARLTQINLAPSMIRADLVVKVKDLGASLFKELKLLEPYGMGNRAPKLLIKKCSFTKISQDYKKDIRTQQTNVVKAKFYLIDDSCATGFPGIWWGHNREELPTQELCDVIVELDYNNQNDENTSYHVRLIALNPREGNYEDYRDEKELILDWRAESNRETTEQDLRLIKECPSNWDEIFREYQEAIKLKQKLALAYKPPSQLPPQKVWQQLIGIAKYLSRTGESGSREQVKQKLGLSEVTLNLGLEMLEQMGFKLSDSGEIKNLCFNQTVEQLNVDYINLKIRKFMEAVAEEQFQQQYFAQVSLNTIQDNVSYSRLVGNIKITL